MFRVRFILQGLYDLRYQVNRLCHPLISGYGFGAVRFRPPLLYRDFGRGVVQFGYILRPGAHVWVQISAAAFCDPSVSVVFCGWQPSAFCKVSAGCPSRSPSAILTRGYIVMKKGWYVLFYEKGNNSRDGFLEGCFKTRRECQAFCDDLNKDDDSYYNYPGLLGRDFNIEVLSVHC